MVDVFKYLSVRVRPPDFLAPVLSVHQSEERAQFEILKAQMFAERAAKRERRPKRARAMAEEEAPSAGRTPLRARQHYAHEYAVNHVTNASRVSLQQPVRKDERAARSRHLIKS